MLSSSTTPFSCGFLLFEWYHHSTIKRGSQLFFYTKPPLFPFANSVSSCKKNRNFSGNRNIYCGKAFRCRHSTPNTLRPENGGFLSFPPFFSLPPVRLPANRPGTGCQPHFAGHLLGRFFSPRAAGWGGTQNAGDPVVVFDDFAHLTSWNPLKYKQPT